RIDEIRAQLPELPDARKIRYAQLGIAPADAQIITASRTLADYFEEAARLSGNAKEAAKWIVGEMMRQLKERSLEPEAIPFPASYLAQVITLCETGRVTIANAKNLFSLLFESGEEPAALVEKHGLAALDDDDALDAAVEEAVSRNPKSVEDFLAGKEKSFGFLMGQCMRSLKGKADPAVLREKLTKKLEALK
ncbi:MAG: Asp-tRNA(Asn)/Glu-tRNA(Gln) amidotransferase GatCAB subunit B, partial [Clostridia bacterium]|nr:Asp-tRNA(Asn)/Glu-tRNA(Gln) amidotransferase GatCAB subunit B [Clostridia bacterium]